MCERGRRTEVPCSRTKRTNASTFSTTKRCSQQEFNPDGNHCFHDQCSHPARTHCFHSTQTDTEPAFSVKKWMVFYSRCFPFVPVMLVTKTEKFLNMRKNHAKTFVPNLVEFNCLQHVLTTSLYSMGINAKQLYNCKYCIDYLICIDTSQQ